MHKFAAGAMATIAMGIEMKLSAIILSLAFVASAATVANAAPKHHHHAAAAATASKSDWPGNPYMDNRPDQVGAFWRDAFNPWAAGSK
jgi:hypothetical protein